MATIKTNKRISKAEYGSDVIAEAIRELGIEYIALNPGASYRGVHDSLVNYLGNTKPEMILCNHEEIAVAIAHGYGRAAGKPMVAFVHDIVMQQRGGMHELHAGRQRDMTIALVAEHLGTGQRQHRPEPLAA